ncbi:MAG: right-handed parallel beta-helix repeat-containing protein [Bacteroidales bacterium]|nr:right-handed parallel beta-helix repeat-containing protein [Bacteroidales bacterium]
MKKLILLLCILTFWIQSSQAQVTTNGGSGLATTYLSLADAITALNIATISSPVIITLDAANPQTAPAGGYTITASGSITNTILIQGSSNTITAQSPQVSGQLYDAIFKIIGGDFITLEGFIMLENVANTTTTAATNNMTEWGVALLYSSTTDGAQNNTISNCTISLNRTYQNTFGIYSNSTHAATTPTISTTATSTAGGNSGLTITDNTISNVNMGIVVIGPFAATDHNDVLTIGGIGNANTITNYGTTASFSAFANVSATVNGILVKNTKNTGISYNTITSSEFGTTSGTLYGIQYVASSNAPTGTFSNSISYNSISLKSSQADGNIYGIYLDITTASTTSTLNVNNNDFNNFGHYITGFGYGDITFISNAGTHLNQSISNNTFTNLDVFTGGDIIFISNTNTLPANGIKNINNNSIVTAFDKNDTGGTITFYTDNGDSPNGTTENNNNNNFSNITALGATIYGWSNQDGTTGALPTKTIQNNTFTNITSSGAVPVTAISASYSSPSSIITENTITNLSCGNWLTAITLSSYSNFNVYSNTINNLNSPGIVAISLSGGGTNNFYQHEIYTLNAESSVVGIQVGSSGTQNIYENVIRGLSCSWGGSSAYPIARGIYLLGANTVNIYKNKIYDISFTAAPGSPSAKIEGIGMLSAISVSIYNNLLGDFRAPLATGTEIINGMSIGSTSTNSNINVYYNTIYLSGTGVTDFGSSGIYHKANTTATTGVLDLRDNLIINNCTPNGTGKVVAFRRSAGTAGSLANYAATSNNNVFYAGLPDATHLIYSDGTNSAQTIGEYVLGVFPAGTIAPRDALSFTENPTFLSITGSDADYLHINTAAATQIDNSGAVISGLTVDYDGDSRSISTPDIGADEFVGTFSELTDPFIIYTTLGSTTPGINRSFGSVTIVDASGVNTSGGTKPRVYFKKTTDANDATGWKYVEANGVSSPFDFTIDYSLLTDGSVAVGDIIQYFVVAQDLAAIPNVGIVSGIFNASPTSVALTSTAFPVTGSINQYNILQALNGTITVGTGGTYTTLTGAGGLFSAINSNILTGNVTANIMSDITETGTNALNQWMEEGIGNYTLTIQPNAAALKTISATYAGGLIRLNGADRVAIDGRYGGAGKYLHFKNNATNGAVIQVISLGTGAGATDNTIRNCYLTGGSVTATNYGIYIGQATLSTTGKGDDNDNLTIQENIISKANYGIFCRANSTGLTDNLQILNNEIGSSTVSEYIGKYGIDVTQASGASISGNIIYNFIGTTANPTGILIGTGFVNSAISANKIYSLKYTGTSASGGKAIDINTGSSGSALNIYNNLIYDITGDGYINGNNSAIYGIRIRDNQGGISLYYNAVNLNGSISRSAATSDQNYALYIGSGVTNINLKNNIFSNTIENTTGVSTSYAIYSASANSAFTSIDNNDYFVSGSEGVLGYLSANKTTLTDWRAATTHDASSIADDPLFTSATDLAPQAGSPVIFAGSPIAGISSDYTGTTRDATNPSIGAYEFENGSTGNVVLYGADDNALNYDTWMDGSNEGIGFGPWVFTTNQGTGTAYHFLGNPANAGITGMSVQSFGLMASPNSSGAYAKAERTLITPLPVGSTLSIDWGISWDFGIDGISSINLYTGGIGGTPIVRIFAYELLTIINENVMFLNNGFNKTTLNFEYQGDGNLRVYGTGPDGSETYDQVIYVGQAPDAIRLYAGNLIGGVHRCPYFDNLHIETSPSNVTSSSTTVIKGEVFLNDPITTSNLNIGSGNILNVNPNKHLTVNGVLSNVAGTSGLVIKSDATGTGSLIHNTNNVNATIERFLTGNSNTNSTYDYHQVSIPLNADITAAQFTGMYLFEFDPIVQNYVTMGSETNTILDNNQGYVVFYPQTSTTLNYIGQINNGSFTGSTPLTAAGQYCLVPNPYPSAIDWDAVNGWTKTNLQDAFYLWDPTVSNNYVSWSAGAGTAMTGTIPVGQSFFVESDNANPVLSMTNSVRVHSGQAFWKETNEKVSEVFHLKVTDPESADEIVVRFSDRASNERGYMDADKLYGADIAPQLYSLSPTTDKLTINALTHSMQTIVVPVGLEYFTNGRLTFIASGLESFASTVTIYLEDKSLNKMIDLKETPVYSFNHITGTDALRFNLYFYGVNSTPEMVSKDYSIWSSEDQINIHIPEFADKKAIVELYDLPGRQLFAEQLILNTITRIPIRQYDGFAIVRVVLENKVYTEKVYLR